MEGSQRQLRTGLTDRLGSYDTNGFTGLDQSHRGEVTPVAEGTYAALRLTREYRSDFNFLDRCLGNIAGLLFVDQFIRFDDDIAGERILNIVNRNSTQDSIGQRLDNFLVVFQRRNTDTAKRTAVRLHDRHILSDIHETPRQVAGVGRLERRVGETLTSTVRGDEVLEDRQPFLEVRNNRVLDDLTGRSDKALLRLGHQTTHSAELPNLLLRSSSTGVRHHVDGVEAFLVCLQCIKQYVGDAVVCPGPDVNDLVVALVLGNEAQLIVATSLLNFAAGGGDQLLLRIRNDDVGQGERQAGCGGHLKPESLDVVKELGRSR